MTVMIETKRFAVASGTLFGAEVITCWIPDLGSG